MSAATVRLSVDEVVRATGGRLVRGTAVGLRGLTTDSRKIEPGCLFIGIAGEKFDGSDFAQGALEAGAGAVVVDVKKASRVTHPGAVIAVDDTTRALGLLARWFRASFKGSVVAITGSNGKTTTKEMLAAILSGAGSTLATEGNLNNEIGAPLTLFNLERAHQYAVIELGMNHEGEIGRLTQVADPDVGLVTCAAPVHVEHLGSIEGVARAKGELYTGLRLDAVAVANADDALMAERAKYANRRTIWFGTSERADVRLGQVTSHDRNGLAFQVFVDGQPHDVRLPVVGLHNALNACAAIAAARALGLPMGTCVKELAHARPPGRRLRLGPIAGVAATLLDDCYNANPHSTVAAVKTLSQLAEPRHRIAVLGDMRELGADEERGHREVGAAAAAADLKLLVAFGRASHFIAEEARNKGLSHYRIVHTDDPAKAAEAVRGVLAADDLVLVKASRGTRLERVSDLLAPPRADTKDGH